MTTLDDNSIRFSLLDMDDVPRQSARMTVPALVAPTLPVAPAVIVAPTVSAPVAQTSATAPVAPVARARPVAPVARSRAQIAREEMRLAQQHAREAVEGAIRIALGSEDGTYPHGCIAAWRHSGKRSWEVIARAAESAGVTPPSPRSIEAIASAAVRSIECAGLKVTVVTRGSEWSVYRPAKIMQVGQSIGDAEVIARLNGEILEVTGPDDLVSTVRYAFDFAQRNAMLISSDVTAWLVEVLTSWRAVDTVYGYWVPPGRYTDAWIRLANALADIGMRIPREPGKVASIGNMRSEIVAGLLDEVTALITKIGKERAHAPKDFGVTAASNKLCEIADIRAKLALYEALTGPLPEARAELDALATELEPLANGVAQRGGLLEFA